MILQTPAEIGPSAPSEHAQIGNADRLPADAAMAVVSISPVMLPVEARALPMEMRITFPIGGARLPVILLSHGQGMSNNLSSLNGYGPVVNYWAAHGFVVIQPTHLSSRALKIPPDTGGAPMFWQSRVEDMKQILDHIEIIAASVPLLAGRIDTDRVAIVGHSMGAHTAGMLLGARLTLEDGNVVDLSEPRIKAGVLLTPAGSGGADLSKRAYDNFAFFRHPSFVEMTTPALVVIGETDISPHLTVRGADWHADPYRLSPGPKSLLTLTGGQHLLGGISGYDAKETTDESPERVAALNRLVCAYLRSTLYPGDPAWSEAGDALAHLPDIGKLEHK